jgi:molybdopterin molybdotransferase
MASTTTQPWPGENDVPVGRLAAGRVSPRPPPDERAVAWPEARRLAGRVPPLAACSVPLPQARRRALAEDVTALADLPSADNAAKDGWAVAGPPPWRVVADMAAGGKTGRPLSPGECAAVATGAVVPAGTHAVLPIEDSDRDALGVRPTSRAMQGRTHIRRAGEEACAGDLLVRAGSPHPARRGAGGGRRP